VEKNIFYIIVIASSLMTIPLFFIDVKKIPKPILYSIQVYFVSLIIFIGLYISGFTVSLFGKSYSYQTVPSPIKEKIELFIEESNKRSVNIGKIAQTKIVYLPWTVTTALFSAACDKKTNTLYLPEKEISTTTIIHELGHCVLGYDHYFEEKDNSEIMYFANNEYQKLDQKTLDNFFYNSPNPSLTAQSIEHSLKFITNPFSLISGLFLFFIFYTSFKGIYETIKNRKKT